MLACFNLLPCFIIKRNSTSKSIKHFVKVVIVCKKKYNCVDLLLLLNAILKNTQLHKN